jgi:hypothetical protein
MCVLPFPGQPPQQRMVQSKMSIAQRLSNPVLGEEKDRKEEKI